MAYWTTKDVARYLHLNEKKVYALVAAGQLPAARISGKWLFERNLVDRWIREHTTYPSTGVMSAVLDRLLVVQGSDDWLLDQVLDFLRDGLEVSVVSSRVGSLHGLQALRDGRAHLAGLHLDARNLKAALPVEPASYLFGLYRREQGLVVAPGHRRSVRSLAAVAEQGLRFAARQRASGTWKLTERLLAEAGIEPDGLDCVGPFSSHLEVALAVEQGQADAGLAIRVAAELAGVPFVPLREEEFQLAIPAAYFGHPTVVPALDLTLGFLRRRRRAGGAPGYSFTSLGRLAAPSLARS
jgi:putative molybdopterin biosynthesis protein